MLYQTDALTALTNLGANSIDSIVTDPPYELGFMNKHWDASGIAYNVDLWREALRVLKPGGHLLAFGGTRTYHRMAVAIEDAGFEIRDSIHWIYGSGFPKSLNVSKAIDKAAGAVREVVGTRTLSGTAATKGRQGRASIHAEGLTSAGMSVEVPVTVPATPEAQAWEGWGTALKPAHEPIVVARKTPEGTIASNVLEHGTGAINIDGCRVEGVVAQVTQGVSTTEGTWRGPRNEPRLSHPSSLGRWPANIVHDGSQEATEQFGAAARFFAAVGHDELDEASFFYCSKAGKKERNAGLDGLPLVKGGSMSGGEETRAHRPTNHPYRQNFHPTVKPVALMRWLVRLVTPPNGIVLDPFAGSGTTLVAAILEGRKCFGSEMTEEYWPLIEGRTRWAYEEANRMSKA